MKNGKQKNKKMHLYLFNFIPPCYVPVAWGRPGWTQFLRCRFQMLFSCAARQVLPRLLAHGSSCSKIWCSTPPPYHSGFTNCTETRANRPSQEGDKQRKIFSDCHKDREMHQPCDVSVVSASLKFTLSLFLHGRSPTSLCHTASICYHGNPFIPPLLSIFPAHPSKDSPQSLISPLCPSLSPRQ